MAFTIKNTFLDLVEDIDAQKTQVKRASSVPRSWKLTPTAAGTPSSGVSTADSEECSWWSLTEQEFSHGSLSGCDDDGVTSVDDTGPPEASSEPSEHGHTSETEGGCSRTVLCLSDAIEVQKPTVTKLSSKARLFKPIAALPHDVRLVMTAAQAALCASPNVTNVHMTESPIGGTTTITGSYSSLDPSALQTTLEIVKMALLDAAANSEQTYIAGYLSQPWVDIGSMGFSANLSVVRTADEDVICWDTIQKGFCPRRCTCRWNHPNETEFAKLVIMLNREPSAY